MTAPFIFHIATETDWHEARRRGEYAADSLSSEGFVHCSESHQVVRVANMRFRSRVDLVLLHIDPTRLTADVRYENLEGGDELFPHVYGALNLEAVTRASGFAPDRYGAFDHHRDTLVEP
jgi:uncharacterized protein (DUF952 family)